MRSGVAFCILIVALVGGLIQILRLRVQANDLLPEYSSLRTDPKGLTVLFDSLKAIGAIPVSRSNQFPPLIKNTDATLVFAGMDLFNAVAPDAEAEELEGLARNGDRVLVSVKGAPRRFEKPQPVWGVRLTAMPQRNAGDNDEPTRWPAYFQAGSDWRVLQSDSGRALILERTFGSGSVVLLASTWPFTNEAMVQDRRSEMLASLLGGRPRIIFDESHLGLEEGGTVMAIGRRFHLQGFLMGLLLLAGLFVWRNLAGFPPDRSQPSGRTGRDALTGLSILLARNVPDNRLIETCLAERQQPGEKRLVTAHGPADRTPVEQFESIRHELHVKKRNL